MPDQKAPPPVAANRSFLDDAIARVAAGEDLSPLQAERAFDAIMAGDASPVKIAALLSGLRARGEVPGELAGGVRALRGAMRPVPAAAPSTLVDTCGTGGGSLTTFNISTAAALVAAAAGVRIAKHGNRSFTSRCGSADVLEELGVTLELTPEGMGEVLERVGIVFMFAPLLHPAMRHAAPVRRELGVRTIMNLLGPLTNPAGARRQVVGVSSPELLELVAQALLDLGHERALVAYGEPGLDELSPLGATEIVDLRDGGLKRYRLDPHEELGWGRFDAGELSGGDPRMNAATLRDVLGGAGSPGARAAVTINAAAAIYVAGLVESLSAGVEVAEGVLESGAGLEKLRALREATEAVAASES